MRLRVLRRGKKHALPQESEHKISQPATCRTSNPSDIDNPYGRFYSRPRTFEQLRPSAKQSDAADSE